MSPKLDSGCAPIHVARAVMLCCLVIIGLNGCASSGERRAAAATELAPAEVMARAMDPMRPVANRVSWARRLDPAGRRTLERNILADLPELWGLEWRARLTLLEVTGGPEALEALRGLQASQGAPPSDRAQRAIATTLERIEDRLASRKSVTGEPAHRTDLGS